MNSRIFIPQVQAKEPTTTTESERGAVAYYDVQRKEILVPNAEGNWNSYSETQFKRILKGRGVSGAIPKGEYVSDIDKTILETQDMRSLAFAGPLAGWPSGVHDTDVGRVLITKGPRLIEPVPGDWPNLKTFFSTLFNDHPAQATVFYGWMKVASESLRQRSFRPGQAFVMAGERGCGKSLCQLIITEAMGGRFSRPYQYLSGKTEFNKDMFDAEHLAIEDDVPSVKLADRRAFGAKIKEITANQGQRLHAKNRDAILLPVFWRLTISVNDEPENLMILPPIDESLKDKIILTKATAATVPCDTQSNEGRARCWEILAGEIPAFLAWLAAWEIPVEFRSGRYGVKEFHHPDIMRTLSELSPEAKMEQLIDAALFSSDAAMTWNGSASELENILTAHASTSYEARRLLSFNTATGVYLSRLAVKSPERYQRTRHGKGNDWTIEPPTVEGVEGFLEVNRKREEEKRGNSTTVPENPSNPSTTADAINLEFDLGADDFDTEERDAIRMEAAL